MKLSHRGDHNERVRTLDTNKSLALARAPQVAKPIRCIVDGATRHSAGEGKAVYASGYEGYQRAADEKASSWGGRYRRGTATERVSLFRLF